MPGDVDTDDTRAPPREPTREVRSSAPELDRVETSDIAEHMQLAFGQLKSPQWMSWLADASSAQASPYSLFLRVHTAAFSLAISSLIVSRAIARSAKALWRQSERARNKNRVLSRDEPTRRLPVLASPPAT